MLTPLRRLLGAALLIAALPPAARASLLDIGGGQQFVSGSRCYVIPKEDNRDALTAAPLKTTAELLNAGKRVALSSCDRKSTAYFQVKGTVLLYSANKQGAMKPFFSSENKENVQTPPRAERQVVSSGGKGGKGKKSLKTAQAPPPAARQEEKREPAPPAVTQNEEAPLNFYEHHQLPTDTQKAYDAADTKGKAEIAARSRKYLACLKSVRKAQRVPPASAPLKETQATKDLMGAVEGKGDFSTPQITEGSCQQFLLPEKSLPLSQPSKITDLVGTVPAPKLTAGADTPEERPAKEKTAAGKGELSTLEKGALGAFGAAYGAIAGLALGLGPVGIGVAAVIVAVGFVYLIGKLNASDKGGR